MKADLKLKTFCAMLVISLMTWTRIDLWAAPKGEIQVDVEPAVLLDINTADALQLEALKGVGPSLAERIIAFREQRGGFQSIDELRQVKGVGEVKFEKIKNQVKVA
ncbi:MAG: helix-hairpin-helix domain-containing protein [Candidatus Omnitrophica bacterium]|nr:helix-hairpin-helix domain-containing protein [Candidatus Omnitrophota bacterium]